MFYTRLKKERRHTEPILTFQLQPQTYIHYNYLRLRVNSRVSSVLRLRSIREQNTRIKTMKMMTCTRILLDVD